MEQKKILICSYRKWANSVKDLIFLNYQDCDLTWIQSKAEFKEKAKGKTYDLALFIGWSWIVPKNFISRNTCVCFHPSDLPKYRGGSPIQNQIIDGLTESKVTAFKMDFGIDTGPIFGKEKISLQGCLSDVLDSIEYASKILAQRLLDACIDDSLCFYKQDESQATVCTRRKPEQSEITINDILSCTSLQLHNKIRSLQDPYPNAYIVCGDGKRLYIKMSDIE
jgi:methionyl-tRNA formyltransferase